MKNTIMTLLWMMTIISFNVSATETSGNCGPIQSGDGTSESPYVYGNNCTWNLENGTLTISGTGAMADFGPDGSVGNNKLAYQAQRPWNEFASQIENVIVSGVTSIGHRAFQDMSHLENVMISDDVTTIGRSAFAYTNNNIQDIVIPSSVIDIRGDAFGGFKNIMYCSEQNREICRNGLLYSSKTEEFVAQMLQIYQMDGGKYIFDNKKYNSLSDYYNGKEYIARRIYTVEEAAQAVEATGRDTVNFRIRYK